MAGFNQLRTCRFDIHLTGTSEGVLQPLPVPKEQNVFVQIVMLPHISLRIFNRSLRVNVATSVRKIIGKYSLSNCTA